MGSTSATVPSACKSVATPAGILAHLSPQAIQVGIMAIMGTMAGITVITVIMDTTVGVRSRRFRHGIMGITGTTVGVVRTDR